MGKPWRDLKQGSVTWSDLGFGRNALASEIKIDVKRARLEESWHRVQLAGLQGECVRGRVGTVVGSLGPSSLSHLRT